MHLPTDYQEYIAKSRYARWLDSERRRETWPETVQRYIDFMLCHIEATCNYVPHASDNIGEITQAIIHLQTMPSMRCLMTAGKALARDNICAYNCCYIPIDSPRAFDELLFILMCGTGVGFSVERQYVGALPCIPTLETTSQTIVVRDSKRGWAEGLRELVKCLYHGKIPQWDVSSVRPAGSRLKTMGGRASGPAPLLDLFAFAIRVFRNAAGRKLTSLECHDLVCKIGECVVAGGVRRSALISLSNLSDLRMREAKAGQWWVENPQRAIANNSVAYTDGRPDAGRFMEEWLALYKSKSGERGIFNREAARRQAIRNGRRESCTDFGTNPCNEIILRPRQFCNLSEIIARADDTFDTLARKVRIATILGTWQSTLTKFRYIGRDFTRNCEEERLLGVSITGLMDCPLLNNTGALARDAYNELREIAIQTNRNWADRLGIPRSAAITCVKPSGTVSQLVGSASGCHPRFAPYYIRRTRDFVSDPLAMFLIDQGLPWENDQLGRDQIVFSWPQRAPEGAITRNQLNAIDHLKLYQFLQDNWCEHKPSVTISVRESEWPSVGAWVWDNFDTVSGVSFLPMSEHSYVQAPFEEISKSQYEELIEAQPSLDWTKLSDYEQSDMTTGVQDLACTAGQCEI